MSNVKRLIDVQIGDVITCGTSAQSHERAWNQCLVVDKALRKISPTNNEELLYIKLERPYMHYSNVPGIAYIGLERFELIKSLHSAAMETCHYHL